MSKFLPTRLLVNNGTACKINRHFHRNLSTPVVIGMGLAGTLLALSTRSMLRTWRGMKLTANLTGSSPYTYYHQGGFLDKMTRKEASMILGVREFANAAQVKDAHRKIMIANHPDRGGSPYLALKINEAKSILDDQ